MRGGPYNAIFHIAAVAAATVIASTVGWFWAHPTERALAVARAAYATERPSDVKEKARHAVIDAYPANARDLIASEASRVRQRLPWGDRSCVPIAGSAVDDVARRIGLVNEHWSPNACFVGTPAPTPREPNDALLARRPATLKTGSVDVQLTAKATQLADFFDELLKEPSAFDPATISVLVFDGETSANIELGYYYRPD
jgi:hypothetical protein